MKNGSSGEWAGAGRQMKVIEYIHAHGLVKSGDPMRVYGISRQAAGKELSRMTEIGLIRTEEKGRATRSVMA